MPAYAWLLLAAALGGTLALGLLLARVRSINRRVGSFECAVRPDGRTGWTSGIASYGVDRLDWYRVVSASPRPARSWPRARLEIIHRAPRRSGALLTSVMELRCRVGSEVFSLAMSRPAADGLTSWLEAAPPGGRLTLR